VPSALPTPARAQLVQVLTEDHVLFTRYEVRNAR
jgi:hypothetical protein